MAKEKKAKVELAITSGQLWALRTVIGGCESANAAEGARIRKLFALSSFTAQEREAIGWVFIEMPPGEQDQYRFTDTEYPVTRRLTRAMRKKIVELIWQRVGAYRSTFYRASVVPVLEALGEPVQSPDWPEEVEFSVILELHWLAGLLSLLDRATAPNMRDFSRILSLYKWASLSEEEQEKNKHTQVQRDLTKERRTFLINAIKGVSRVMEMEFLVRNIDPLLEALGEELPEAEWEDEEGEADMLAQEAEEEWQSQQDS